LPWGSTSNIVRSMYAAADINRKVDDVFEYDAWIGIFIQFKLLYSKIPVLISK
jgi:hypothetical protein